MTPSRLPLVLMLPILASAVWGAEPRGDVSPPKDDEPYWTVGVAAFAGLNLSPENLYLTDSIPLLFRERLESIRQHFFTDAEKAGYQKAVIQRESRRQGERLEALRRERDALFFKESPGPALKAKQAGYDLQIRQAIDRLNFLRGLPPQSVAFPEKKQIRFAASEREELLLPVPGHSPLRAARQKPVNLLIWGRFEEVQGYLYFEVRALDSALEREVFFYNDAATREQLPAVLAPAIEELARILWGQDWASLYVRTDPPEARIYLDGTLVGTGQARLDFETPGERELRAELEGYVSQARQLTLVPYSLLELSLTLEKKEGEPILLSSEPLGAALYRGSSWLGNTPLEVERPDSLSRFLLRREGYRDEALYLGAGSGPQIAITLAPESLDPMEQQKKGRNRFYTAFGLFALSIPLPLFFWGYVNDYLLGYLSAVNAGEWSEAQRIYDSGFRSYYAYLATLGVSVSLSVNMLVHLIRYVRAADRKG